MRNLRKFIAILAAALLLVLPLTGSLGTARAEEESRLMVSFAPGGTLKLDTVNRYAVQFYGETKYDVMLQSYNNGYMPAQRAAGPNMPRLYCILPILPDGIQAGSSLTASVNRPGDGFAFVTLRQEGIPLSTGVDTYNAAPQLSPVAAPTADTPAAAMDVYLVALALPLEPTCPSGTYEIPVTIDYVADGGMPESEIITLYANVSGLDAAATPVPERPQATPVAANLVLDNMHVYPGMDTAYSQGYVPRVENGAARIVMPLLSTGEGLKDTVVVSPDLGAAENSPFVYANYQTTVKRQTHTLADGSKVSAYLVDLSLPLAANRTNGQYPVTLSVQGEDVLGEPRSLTYTVYVTVADANPGPADPGGDAVLAIDSTHTYPGMSASYAMGYVPTVKEGQVRVVMPLVSLADLTGVTLTVTPGLGDANTCPFVYANYQKTVTYGSFVTLDGQTVQGFLVDMNLPLRPDRTNGQYPLDISVQGRTSQGEALSLHHTLYVTIADGKTQPSVQPTVESPLQIESAHAFSGMSASYAKGYIPTVSGGSARIVLPLVSSAKLVSNEVTITPDLGDTSSSPFVYANYEQTFRLAEHTAQDGSKVSCYLVDMNLPLAASRFNGRYPVLLKARYRTDDTTVTEQSFMVYVTITDGKNPNAGGGIPGAPDTSQSKVIISGYSVSPSPVQAGSSFEVRLMLQNTSEKRAVSNIKFTYKGESDTMTSVDQTNTKYFDTIEPGEALEVVLNMAVTMDVEAKPQRLLLAMEYEDNGTTLSAEDVILVPVEQPIRMELDKVNMVTSAYLNDMVSASLNIFNMGRTPLYNVLATLEVPGLTPEGSVFVGNMEPGSSRTAEFMVTFSGDPNSVTPAEGGEGMEEFPMDFPEDPDAMDNVMTDPMVAPAEEPVAIAFPEDDFAAEEFPEGEFSADVFPEGEFSGDEFFGEDPMGGGLLLGEVTGRILVTFEDENGTKFSREVPVTTVIEDTPVLNPGVFDEPEVEQPKATQWWVSAAIGGGVLAALITTVALLSRKRRRKVSSYENEVA